MELSLQAQLESLLFWKGEPVSLKELATLVAADEIRVHEALQSLGQDLISTGRGIVLLTNDTTYELVTHASMSSRIEALTKEELTKDLSKAALETLSIILYRSPIKRSEIDYIRGVNSQTILRILSIRGLIDKQVDPKDERAYVYTPSTEILKFLGVTQKESIIDFITVNSDIDGFLNQQEDTEPEIKEKVEEKETHG